MKNFNFKFNKDLFNYILVSIFSSFTVLAFILFLAINYRGEIFNYLAQGYLKENSNLVANSNSVDVNKDNLLAQVLPSVLENTNTNSLNSKVNLSVADVVKKVNPAVVSIVIYQEVPKYETFTSQNPFGDLLPGFFFNIPQYRQNGTERKQVGGGSGFFVSRDGLIVTNRHVVDNDNAEYEVLTSDGKKYKASVVAKDSVLDIALIKISGNNFSFLSLGDSDKLEIGQSVVAIGNALAEFNNSVSVGIVSGLSRSITAGDSRGRTEFLDQVIQTDAAINPGNSGGPLINMQGEVIGVNVAVAQGSQNIGFALPINNIKTVISSVKDTGKILRPYLGIRYVPINEELQKANNLSVNYGILVQGNGQNLAVLPNSPASKVGLVANDIILEIDGIKLDSKNNFASIIRNKKVGQVITLKVLSNDVEKILRPVLEGTEN